MNTTIEKYTLSHFSFYSCLGSWNASLTGNHLFHLRDAESPV